jgi:hypothetical protein
LKGGNRKDLLGSWQTKGGYLVWKNVERAAMMTLAYCSIFIYIIWFPYYNYLDVFKIAFQANHP